MNYMFAEDRLSIFGKTLAKATDESGSEFIVCFDGGLTFNTFFKDSTKKDWENIDVFIITNRICDSKATLIAQNHLKQLFGGR